MDLPRIYSDAPFGGVVKRALDVLIAPAALIVLAPVMLAVALAVKVQDGGPVLFVQRRVGRGGAEFKFLKYRTMVPDGAALLQRLMQDNPEIAREWRENQKLARDPRVTMIGGFLRRSSLDELPQLVNVVLGDMSIVGPRPMLPEQVEVYGPVYERYCQARPGITGLWQVSGRSETSFSRRSDLDQAYLQAWSIRRDLLLILRTFGAVLRQRGAC
ncbi:sugar transferase [Phenylobacterium sp. LjRoot225]|uniref:sugar transferase n=1 Tax=Phenylobacterium sp. LjRoot225 TaxID=3342285 RepID=UPI003ED15174